MPLYIGSCYDDIAIKCPQTGMLNPGAETMFKSLYNNGNGAKVINGSWGTNYRAYSDFCQVSESWK